jgi:hypothetical protein
VEKAKVNGHRMENRLPKEWCEVLMPGTYAKLDTVTVGEVEITPEAAQVILDQHMPVNRNLIESQAAALVKHILAGTFTITGETLIFNTAGHCINGKHRLTACVRANQPIRVLVVLGVEPEVFKLLDQHVRRNTSHVLGMLGEVSTGALSSTVVQVGTFLAKGTLGRDSNYRPNINDNLAVLENHAGIRDSIQAYQRIQKTLPFPSTGLAVATHYLASRVDADLAEALFGYLSSTSIPENSEAWSGPRLLLKELQRYRNARKRLSLFHLAALAVKAWNGLHQGRLIKQLHWQPSKEDFPRFSGWTYRDGLPVAPEAVEAAATTEEMAEVG